MVALGLGGVVVVARAGLVVAKAINAMANPYSQQPEPETGVRLLLVNAGSV